MGFTALKDKHICNYMTAHFGATGLNVVVCVEDRKKHRIECLVKNRRSIDQRHPEVYEPRYYSDSYTPHTIRSSVIRLMVWYVSISTKNNAFEEPGLAVARHLWIKNLIVL